MSGTQGPLETRCRTSVPTLLALESLDATPFLSGEFAFVEEEGQLYQLDRSSNEPIDHETVLPVAPPGSVGRWTVFAELDRFRVAITTTDATPVVRPLTIIEPSQTVVAVVGVSAHNDINMRRAFALQPEILTRYGNGPIIGNTGPLPDPLVLNYDPNVAPWNTITATLVEIAPGTGRLGVQVTGLNGVSILWNIAIEFRTFIT